MKLYVKNKIVSLGDGSKVYDENGQPYLFVKGAVFTLRKRKKITDLEHNALYKVKNKIFHLMRYTAYICDAHGKRIISIKEKDRIINKGYIIKCDDAEYDIEWGGWLTGVNKLYKNGELFATINRKLGFTDVFELTFDNAEDAALLVAFAIAIDNITDRNDS